MRPNLSEIEAKISAVYEQYPANSFKCDIAADEVGSILLTDGFDVDILEVRSQFRAAKILFVNSPSGDLIRISETGWHRNDQN